MADEGRAIVGKNAERHKEIYRRSEATTFLTELCLHYPSGNIEKGRAIVGKNRESHERNVSESTIFLTEVVVSSSLTGAAKKSTSFDLSISLFVAFI